MDNPIISIVVELLNAVGGYHLGQIGQGAMTPISEASPVAYEAMRQIADTVVRPVASVILSLMLVVELARNASKFEGDGQIGVRIIAGTMFKFVLLIVAVQYAPQILQAISGVTETISQGVAASASTPETTASGKLGDQIKPHLNMLNAIPVLIILALPFIISWLAVIVAQAVVIFRFIEIYALTAFATLPIAFAAHPETKSIAVGYLRAYGSVSLQGATLILGIYLYQLMIQYGGFAVFPDPQEIGPLGMTVTGWALKAVLPVSLAAILMIFVVIGSSKLAKSIVGQAG